MRLSSRSYFKMGSIAVFVPIIGKSAVTFKKILEVWNAVHRHLLTQGYPELIHWWADICMRFKPRAKTSVRGLSLALSADRLAYELAKNNNVRNNEATSTGCRESQ